VIYKFRTENNWRKVDFNTSGRMAKHLEIVAEIWKVFYEKGMETKKKIFLSDELETGLQVSFSNFCRLF